MKGSSADRERKTGWSSRGRAIGREAETEGQVRVIFGRKRPPLEVFETNSVFAFPCSWDWWRDWQHIPSNMPTHCSPLLPAWPYSPNGVPLAKLGPCTHTLTFTTQHNLSKATVYWPTYIPSLLFLSCIWIRLTKWLPVYLPAANQDNSHSRLLFQDFVLPMKKVMSSAVQHTALTGVSSPISCHGFHTLSASHICGTVLN